ncbi:A/G-specific adenine glycosylase [Egicoccus halophilus]|uniref:A/G-specific adenine glycosylase n=1 Tax=Egicoccus halophilus TaxID=1670830 RepID=UPI001E4E1412|nr:A/G-specific adenine glycosylase [Egicoccus halophilus]
MRVPTLADRLLQWGAETRRDLPWRRTRDPWAVLVSELMLQQTQVARVLPRYRDFLDRFPTPQACADAAPGEVVRRWDGLGYNRRALNLHRAAVVIVDEYGGRLPDDLEALLALPGVGPYTARAVLAFAFERDHGVVDTNAARVLARAVAGRRLGPREAQALADAQVPAGAAWAWNQAMLDLGATVCTKRSPRCERCPLQPACAWFSAGLAEPDPAVGSAGVSTPQARFEGSDRQGRGRLVQALRTGPLERGRLADVAGWPEDPDRAQRIADTLVAEGLAEYVDGQLSLPH